MSEVNVTPHLARAAFDARRSFYEARGKSMRPFAELPTEVQELERDCVLAALGGLADPGGKVLDDGARALAEINGVAWADLTTEGRQALTRSALAIWTAMNDQAVQDLRERQLWMP